MKEGLVRGRGRCGWSTGAHKRVLRGVHCMTNDKDRGRGGGYGED